MKSETRAQHDEAEHHPLHEVIFGSEGVDRAREAYGGLLGQHLHVQEAFEPLLRRAAAGTPAFGSLVRPHHYHLAALRDDLVALGVRAEHLRPLPAAGRFASFIERCGEREGWALLGVFYVFEGSTNGGTIVGKRIKDLLRLEGETGTRFINPHGREVRPRWAAWKAAFDALELDEPRCGAIIAAAQETFRLSRSLLDDVRGAMGDESVVVRAQRSAVVADPA